MKWKRFWYFKVYCFSVPAICHSHINRKLEVKMIKTIAVQKEEMLDCVDIAESNFIY